MKQRFSWFLNIHTSNLYTPYLLVVVATYVYIIVDVYHDLLPSSQFILLALGFIYISVGIYGSKFCVQHRSRWMVGLYFSIQIVLSCTILYLSRGSGFLVIIPLVAHATIFLSRRGTILLSTLLLFLVSATSVVFSGKWQSGVELFFSMLAAFTFIILFTQTFINERQIREELNVAHAKLREYALQSEELATVAERNRLAREIHDSLGHSLTTINMQLEAARAVFNADPGRTLEALNKAQQLTREGLEEVRRSIAALRASPLENRTLAEAIARLVEENNRAGILTELRTEGKPRLLTPQVELTLFRVAQEGLTNVRKHANASAASITLDYREKSHIRLSIQDNGTGRNIPQEGFGLLGLSERAQILGGTIQTQTAPGEGFTLEVELAS